MEIPRYCEHNYIGNIPTDRDTHINSSYGECAKFDPASESAMGEVASGGSFKKMRLVRSPLKRENLEIKNISALQLEKRQNKHLNEQNNEVTRDIPYKRNDYLSNNLQYYHYSKGLETPHEKEATQIAEHMHEKFLFQNQGTYSSKLFPKGESGGSQNCPAARTNKYEANPQMTPLDKLSKKYLMDNCPKDNPSDCEKSTEYNSAQNILRAFENGVYVDSQQTLPLEGTNSDAYFTKEALNSISTISYSPYDYPPKGEDEDEEEIPGLVNSGTHIFFNKKDPITQDKEKLLNVQMRENNAHFTNRSSISRIGRQNVPIIGGYTTCKEKPQDEETTYYNYQLRGEAEVCDDKMCDALEGYQNKESNMASVNIKTGAKNHHPLKNGLAHYPDGDLLYMNKANRGSPNINNEFHHPLNYSVLSNGYLVHDEDSKKLGSISNRIITRNSAGKEGEAENGAFMTPEEDTPMDHFNMVRKFQPNGFIGENYNTHTLSRSNLCDNPADLISDEKYYYNNHVNNTFLNGRPNAYGLKQSKGCVLQVDSSRRNGSSHGVGLPSVTILPDQHTTHKTGLFNGEDEQNMSPTIFTKKMNDKHGIYKGIHQHVSGKKYLSTFVQNDYELDEIKSCIPERHLYGKENYDVPQVIQGITRKQNNGIVSECNQDTIIEYNDKWRLVKGKQFSINQVDNFKSVQDSATYFQNYLTEQNENTKRMLTKINFNSLTGKLSINSLGDDNGDSVKHLSRVYDYKDTLRSYPAYYGISQNMHTGREEALKCMEEDGRGILQNDHPTDCKNMHEQMQKKKKVAKKPNLALCGVGDYQLKNRIQDFVSQKIIDFFNVNFV
ncbi:conserved Plasmodium protein, unknown function [Plasmodium knowlesi strain H]|uniref:Uncharacterized protein n=3 Tax=Plasmodium knowlesi TaxID=5850 RepID=A0A5K1USY6_PLAKH|nr:conserved Plasmodium protein, unknown function [Plasmodium knowlesi strain H]OTN65570.1 Uncharacterized protein PKNOH_S110095600 [Plasmodium knowlesi]CAA9989575.1 conserved Plasmodium protein, unknown function [Plasmodium knowlesi strain H]SBO22620.1 conserved Plasmodium protein, unknown function [Plasmodium knowlesi strain H]SBO23441.1 conserved Plasmodium protein, unknown function [Plasmodium knowlesi strain H]VVS79049.1 conserved Plasmodium protein, unknown function [Plasmodium knowlesi |eukprot:XP_002260300.1 hypothetical protein, conserved in Plasmodium species [Plasmodium knowlesi strain H]